MTSANRTKAAAVLTGCVRFGGGEGILVHDLNGDGMVGGIAELFGSATADGFDALALLDSNHGGKIDTGDDAFGWMDRTGRVRVVL